MDITGRIRSFHLYQTSELTAKRWEGGALFDGLVNYQAYTGDHQYDNLTAQALLFQKGDDNNYEPRNQTLQLVSFPSFCFDDFGKPLFHMHRETMIKLPGV